MKVLYVLLLNFGFTLSQNLFFSEYAEGSSNNKYLEIFNGGLETINLNNYQLVNCSNDCDAWEHSHSFYEDISLNVADLWIICAVGANDAIKAECNQTIANNSIFNGNDVWAIQEIYTNTILDKIGEIGDDPGSGWEVAGTSHATKDHTLIRKESVLSGNTEWTASAGTNADNSEWIILEKDDFTNLGFHICSACGESTNCNDSSACNFGAEGECTHPLENECDCDGNFLDCANVCGGGSTVDNCGTCDTDNSNDCIEDCAGIWGGNATTDECGICNGPGAVYECGCSELNEGTCDCDGNELDECNICGGPGSIYECGCIELSAGTCDCDGNELDACGNCGGSILDSANCALELKTVQPQNYQSINAYPNPFNSSTTITLKNLRNAIVKLDIIDLNGRIIDSIHSGYLSGLNTHTFLWDGVENNSGIYFARISQNNYLFTHKIILLK